MSVSQDRFGEQPHQKLAHGLQECNFNIGHQLIQAVGSLLVREGFTGLKAKAVSREAGEDKVLIYRYFGGLPEPIATFGREGDFWPSIKELAEEDIEACGRQPIIRAATTFQLKRIPWQTPRP